MHKRIHKFTAPNFRQPIQNQYIFLQLKQPDRSNIQPQSVSFTSSFRTVFFRSETQHAPQGVEGLLYAQTESAVPGSERYTCFLSSSAAKLLHPCLCSLETSLCRQTSKINNALPPTPCWVTVNEHPRAAPSACKHSRAAAVPSTHIHTLPDMFHRTALIRKHCQAPPSPSLFVSFCLSPSTTPSTVCPPTPFPSYPLHQSGPLIRSPRLRLCRWASCIRHLFSLPPCFSQHCQSSDCTYWFTKSVTLRKFSIGNASSSHNLPCLRECRIFVEFVRQKRLANLRSKIACLFIFIL